MSEPHATDNENLLPAMTGDRRPMTGCLLSFAGLPSPVPGLFS
jgi:hypothetical protein